DVVQQLDLVAEGAPHVLEQLRHQPRVRARLPGTAVERRSVGRFGRGAGWSDLGAAGAVGRVAGQFDLAADVAVALLDEAPGAVLDLLEVAAGGVDVDVRRAARLAA